MEWHGAVAVAELPDAMQAPVVPGQRRSIGEGTGEVGGIWLDGHGQGGLLRDLEGGVIKGAGDVGIVEGDV